MWKLAGMAKMAKAGSSGKNSWITPLIVVVVLGVVVLFGSQVWEMMRNMLEGLGMMDSKEDKAVDKALNDKQTGSDSAWSGSYWKTVNGGAKPMYYADADKIVKDIWDAFGGFNDYEAQAIGAIKKCKSKAQVSFVVERFYAYHKMDLVSWLQGQSYPNDRLSNEDLNMILNYVKALPK